MRTLSSRIDGDKNLYSLVMMHKNTIACTHILVSDSICTKVLKERYIRSIAMRYSVAVYPI